MKRDRCHRFLSCLLLVLIPSCLAFAQAPSPSHAPQQLLAASFGDGRLDGWQSVGGSWSAAGGALSGQASGDAWCLYRATASDFSYSGKVHIESGNAAGLSFRMDASGATGYDAILDRVDGRLKLCTRPYAVLAEYRFPVELQRSYAIRVEASGASLRVFLDGVLRIEVSDSRYASGLLGVFAYSATARYDGLSALGPADAGLSPGWTAQGGAWSQASGRFEASAQGDAWYINDASSADFSYTARLCVASGNAAGVSFRSNESGSQGYDAIVDVVDGRLKLCRRPYAVIADYRFPAENSRPYTVTVVVRGTSIKVYLDGTLRIDAEDSSYATGRFGLFAYSSQAWFDSLTLGAR